MAAPFALFDPAPLAWSQLAEVVRDPARMLAVLALDSQGAPSAAEALRLCREAPFPVLAQGACHHPLAGAADCLVEPGFDLADIARRIADSPVAASVLVQLLRLLDSCGSTEALDAESLAYGVLQASARHADWLAGRAPSDAGGGAGEGAVRLDRDGAVLTVALDRPAAGNAIDRPMRDALTEAFELVRLDPTITRVILRAEGKAFSLGAELAEFGTTRDPALAHAIRRITLPARQAVFCTDRLEARIDGACVGAGLELAAFARRIEATPRSWFHLPELAMGLIPGAGGCVSLSRRIGRQRTALMVLSGRRISARRALEWGLVDAVVDRFA